MMKSKSRRPFRALIGGLILILILFSVLPYAALILGSLLPNSATDRGIAGDSITPHQLSLENYYELDDPAYDVFRQQIQNTILVSFLTATIVVGLVIPASYVLTRYRFPARDWIRHSAIWGYLFPPMILVFPYTRLLYLVGLNDTKKGLVLANIAFCFPFALWLTVQYFHAIPRDVDKAAAADGATWVRALWHVMIPRALPGIAAVFAFSVILSWNDVALSLVLVQDSTARTIAAGVQESVLRTQQQTNYGTFAAASLGVAAFSIMIFGLIQNWVDRRLRAEAEQ
jgi:ABC-type glycerol-3-phosphate transport system permease component